MNKSFLASLKEDPNVQQVLQRVSLLYQTKELYPKFNQIFRAFELADLNEAKVVIFGQDPYYQPGVADGLAFSTQQSKTPASLKNIFKELKNEYPSIKLETNDLSFWAKQGVLLLNTTLVVEKNKPHSCKDLGWEYIIKKTIDYLNLHLSKVVFLLWGKAAAAFAKEIDWAKHYVLISAHPSPLSAHQGFLGNNHFLEANKLLKENGKEVIDWNLELKKE